MRLAKRLELEASTPVLLGVCLMGYSILFG
jgi:hypothetical protein